MAVPNSSYFDRHFSGVFLGDFWGFFLGTFGDFLGTSGDFFWGLLGSFGGDFWGLFGTFGNLPECSIRARAGPSDVHMSERFY